MPKTPNRAKPAPRTAPRLTKALETCAREVKDADDFVAHIAHIAQRYRHEHVLDTGARSAEVRKAMRAFQKHSAALAAWLQQARQRSAPQSDALDRLGAALHGVPSLAHSESEPVRIWLTQAERAAMRCLSDTALLPRRIAARAPRVASEALRATFEHHKLKWSTAMTKHKQSDAVRLLCAIAKSAGDAALTPETAQAVLRDDQRRQA